MQLYAGIDLHSNSNLLGILDKERKRIMHKKLDNDPEVILPTLAPYQAELSGIVVESTYNWYWLVDLLQENGYRVHLANPSAIQRYSGLKHADDTDDAFWLAELLCLGVLREGYIYPKEIRPLRDLLRKRSHFVRLRTSLILSLQNIVARNCGARIKGADMKVLREDRIAPLLGNDRHLRMSALSSKECIDVFTRQIREIESAVQARLQLDPPYRQLLTLPGVGQILASTIMVETGPIVRFTKVGQYASYCRKVESKWTSNDKVKGHGNKKNGNRYLAWAFAEAAEHARRQDEACRKFYQRKLRQKKIELLAQGALAHKLARAAFYIMRDNVAYDEARMFGRPEMPIYD